jgi:hypothetical protein
VSVVQRCPNCGTTRATPGECEACHEAQVRYFCTNHTPGVWLPSSQCPQCGARFGEPARRAPVPTAARAPVVKRAPPADHARARTSSPPAYAPSPPPSVSHAEWRGAERMPATTDPREDELGAGGSPAAMWQKVLLAALRSRYLPSTTTPHPARPRLARGAGGCVMRLLVIGLLLLLALVSAIFVFGQALLRGF